MADFPIKTIDELEQASQLQDDCYIPVCQDGVTKKLRGKQIKDYVGDPSTDAVDAVLYTTQSLSAAQQSQARANIGAVSVETFTAALGEVNAALSSMDEVIG